MLAVYAVHLSYLIPAVFVTDVRCLYLFIFFLPPYNFVVVSGMSYILTCQGW